MNYLRELKMFKVKDISNYFGIWGVVDKLPRLVHVARFFNLSSPIEIVVRSEIRESNVDIR
jgi:hypothetical protein